ncbi:MAG: peptidoglycan editing factor PgeF [Candidatus Binataceae bacterium]
MSALSTALREPAELTALPPWHTPGAHAAFLGRTGGYSSGPYGSFNLAGWIGDQRSAVELNWRRFNEQFPLRRITRLRQVHGATVRTIEVAESALEDGDGMVTAMAGVALGIFTADCVPVLMTDPVQRICAALHAGWRGTLAGIAAEGVSAMRRLGARPNVIRAAMGPAIEGCCFEVDSDLAERFAEIPGGGDHIRPGRPGKAYLSLRSILRDQLEGCGLRRDSIISVGPCTRCAHDRFFSRRANAGGVTGLQLSFIGLDQSV